MLAYTSSEANDEFKTFTDSSFMLSLKKKVKYKLTIT